MEFADIHIHLLPGVDDGPDSADGMKKMLEQAYRAGTRVMCCTPHFHPGYFGENREASEDAFNAVKHYASEQCPDMELYLGNELRYSTAFLEWLADEECRTMNGTRYVLIDFTEDEREKTITEALHQLINAGWRPILAHGERYMSLFGEFDLFERYIDNGVVVQMDTQSVFRKFGRHVRKQSIGLLKRGLVDLVSSDAHNTGTRPPEINLCYDYLVRKFGAEYAGILCSRNARRILIGETVERI